MNAAALLLSLQVLVLPSPEPDANRPLRAAGETRRAVATSSALDGRQTARSAALLESAAGRRQLLARRLRGGSTLDDALSALEELVASVSPRDEGRGFALVETLRDDGAAPSHRRAAVAELASSVPPEAVREQLWLLVHDRFQETDRRLAALRALRGDLPTREADTRLRLAGSTEVPPSLALEAARQLRLVAPWLSSVQVERARELLDLGATAPPVRQLAAGLLASARPELLAEELLTRDPEDPLLPLMAAELRAVRPQVLGLDVRERLLELERRREAGERSGAAR